MRSAVATPTSQDATTGASARRFDRSGRCRARVAAIASSSASARSEPGASSSARATAKRARRRPGRSRASARASSSSRVDQRLALAPLEAVEQRLPVGVENRRPRAPGASSSSACSSAGVRCVKSRMPAPRSPALRRSFSGATPTAAWMPRSTSAEEITASLRLRSSTMSSLASLARSASVASSGSSRRRVAASSGSASAGARAAAQREKDERRGERRPQEPEPHLQSVVLRVREHARSLPRDRPAAPRSGCAPPCAAPAGDPRPRARTPRRPGRAASRTAAGSRLARFARACSEARRALAAYRSPRRSRCFAVELRVAVGLDQLLAGGDRVRRAGRRGRASRPA